jgi:proteasome lid subunit RPN8/RPN11
MYKVRVKRGQLDYFRKVARKTNKEVLAYLVGKVVSPELVVIESFEYTKVYGDQTEGAVSWFKEDYEKVKKHAEERGLAVVGDIHSHPNYWPVMSPDDHKNTIKDCHRVCGIYATMGKKSATCFWIADSALPAKIEYA